MNVPIDTLQKLLRIGSFSLSPFFLNLAVSCRIALMAESKRIELIVGAIPWLFISSKLMIAGSAHSSRIVLPVWVSACDFFLCTNKNFRNKSQEIELRNNLMLNDWNVNPMVLSIDLSFLSNFIRIDLLLSRFDLLR